MLVTVPLRSRAVCKEFVQSAKDKQIKVRGPIRIPTKILRHHTRKTPNGEGSKTWDFYELRIHKRVIRFSNCQTQLFKEVFANVNVPICVTTRFETVEFGAKN